MNFDIDRPIILNSQNLCYFHLFKGTTKIINILPLYMYEIRRLYFNTLEFSYKSKSSESCTHWKMFIITNSKDILPYF